MNKTIVIASFTLFAVSIVIFPALADDKSQTIDQKKEKEIFIIGAGTLGSAVTTVRLGQALIKDEEKNELIQKNYRETNEKLKIVEQKIADLEKKNVLPAEKYDSRLAQRLTEERSSLKNRLNDISARIFDLKSKRILKSMLGAAGLAATAAGALKIKEFDDSISNSSVMNAGDFSLKKACSASNEILAPSKSTDKEKAQ